VAAGVPSEAQITGTVTFYEGGTYLGNGTNSGGTVLGTGALSNGVATFTTTALAIGNHSITAVYSGTANILGSSLAIVDQLVTAPPAGSTIFAIGVAPTVTVGVGRSVSLEITITPLNGFPQGVTLGCSNLPPETTCTFANPVIAPDGGSTTLLLSTTAPHSCGSAQPYFLGGTGNGPGAAPLALPVLAGVVAVLLPGRRRWLRALVAIAAVAGAMQISGCDNCTDLGTRPNTYTIQVTGTASGVAQVQTQNIVLTVTI
jgi:hypothetical protein